MYLRKSMTVKTNLFLKIVILKKSYQLQNTFPTRGLINGPDLTATFLSLSIGVLDWVRYPHVLEFVRI